jgi:sulfur-carrier protein
MKILYFGMISERTKIKSEDLVFEPISVSEFVLWLEKKYDFGQFEYKIALNKKIIEKADLQLITQSDTVAVLPPFAGG